MNNDPFGVAILDYFEGNKKASILVNSNITENEKIKVSTLFRTFRSMPEIEKIALDLCSGKILDVGAGSGAHALVLQKQGLDVTALDISPLACDVMHKRGIVNVVNQDIFTFDSDKFDTILFLMNGVGIAGTLDGLDNLLKKLTNLLNKGGKIYLESTDIMYMFVEEDGSMLIDLNGAYYGELQYEIRYDNHTSNFPWLYIDYGTLETHANEQGFNCELICSRESDQYLACLSKI